MSSKVTQSRGDEDLDKLISNFRVSLSDGSQQPLAPWSTWLIKLGFNFSRYHNNSQNLICVSVPDRGFAAAFLSLGAVLGFAVSSFEKNFAYEDRLKRLKVGDLVSMPDSNGFLRSAKIFDVSENSISYFRHGEGHKTTRLISHCKDVWPLMSGESLFRTSAQLIKTEFSPLYGNLSRARKVIELRSSNKVVIVGTEKLLVDELSDATINFQGEILADFVKPFGFVGIADRSQSQIIPSVSDSIPRSLPPKQSFLIFDGASGFMNLYDKLEALNTIVVLDRRARRSLDAAVLVRQLRSQWIGFGSPFRPESVPRAIEFLSWSIDND